MLHTLALKLREEAEGVRGQGAEIAVNGGAPAVLEDEGRGGLLQQLQRVAPEVGDQKVGALCLKLHRRIHPRELEGRLQVRGRDLHIICFYYIYI